VPGINYTLSLMTATDSCPDTLGASTKIQFNTMLVSKDASVVEYGDSGDFLVKEAGIYEISYRMIINKQAAQAINLTLYVNNQPLDYTDTESAYASGKVTLTGSVKVALGVNEVFCLVATNGDGDVVSNQYISIQKID
jgi:hypothetical protein